MPLKNTKAENYNELIERDEVNKQSKPIED